MAQRSNNIFERLRELNSKLYLPVRDFSAYEKLLYINEMAENDPLAQNKWPNWLEVKRPEFEETPVIPDEIVNWVVDFGGQLPTFPPKIKLHFEDNKVFWTEGLAEEAIFENSKGERFDSDKKRVTIWSQWLETAWLPWANGNAGKFEAMRSYERLWSIWQQMERSEGQYELIWCTAVLYWRTEGIEIRHPLLSQRMELEYDAQNGVFNLLATNTAPKIEYEMLFGLLGIDFEKLFDLEQILIEETFDLADKEQVKEFCEGLTKAIGHHCQISDDESLRNQHTSRQPYIYYGEPILLLRKLDGRKWRGELESIVDSIESGGAIADVYKQYYGQKMEYVLEDDYETPKEEQPLFPWPAEAVQKTILEKLQDETLTIVQTLPYSSKEKMIGNLLMHFLAKGKRVLVTGSSNYSLRKVSKLIQEDFKEVLPLCINATGSERENASELMNSLHSYNRQINLNTRDEILREREFLQRNLEICRDEILEEKENLQNCRKADYTTSFVIDGEKKVPWQIAKWLLRSQSNLGYIPDVIDSKVNNPLNKVEMARLFELAADLSLEERKQLSLWRPSLDDLINGEELANLFNTLDDLLAEESKRQGALASYTINDSAKLNAYDIIDFYKGALEEFPLVKKQWINNIFVDSIESAYQSEQWDDFYNISMRGMEKLLLLQAKVGNNEVILSEKGDYHSIKKALENIKDEFTKKGKLSLVYRFATGKDSVKVFQECFFNGENAKNIAEIDLILAKLEFSNEINSFIKKWNGSIAKVNGPRLKESNVSLLESIENHLEKINGVIIWQNKHLENLKKSWDVFSTKEEPQWTQREWLVEMLPKLKVWAREKQFEECQEDLQGQKDLVDCSSKSSEEDIDPICYMMEEALYNRDIEGWDIFYKQIIALNKRGELWREFNQLNNKLAQIAPLWAEEILAKDKDVIAELPQNWLDAWRYNQANSWLESYMQENRLEDINERYLEQLGREKLLIRDTISSSSWEWQLRRVSKEENMALDCLCKSIKLQDEEAEKSFLAREFWREAEFWRLSLPAWIISADTLIETAGTFDKLFDVVIIDESEKFDIFSLCLLLRAKNAIVLGDITLPGSSLASQIKKADALLIEKASFGVSDKEKFTFKDSLYDLSLRLTETEKAVLDECSVNSLEIGNFINNSFYNDKMSLVPLVDAKGDLEQTIMQTLVRPRQMTGQQNLHEVEQMLIELVDVINRPEYDGKSIAIITLGGEEQEKLFEERLLEYLSEEDIVQRQIICTSVEGYTGYKRDIVFVSLVSAKIAETVDRKYLNAIFGAAKEQIRIFHSFDPKDISSRSLIAQLLKKKEYKKELATAKPKYNELVNDIFSAIKKRGYEAILAQKYNKYFDIVVQTEKGKIAVVCDGLRSPAELAEAFVGEEKFIRQGWQFWHIRGCQFYLNEEIALEGLWHLIDRMQTV